MTNHNSASDSLDLNAIAHQAMLDAGFEPDITPEVSEELSSLQLASKSVVPDSAIRDLRSLLWSSIDDRKSRDLDQVEFAESLPGDDIRVLVGIADVDAYVRKGSAIDGHAHANSTSVYTGVKTFHMLPEQLSTDLTSLVAGADRAAIVTEMIVGPNGAVKASDVY